MQSFSIAMHFLAPLLVLITLNSNAAHTLDNHSTTPFGPASGPHTAGPRLRAARTLRSIQARHSIGGALKSDHELYYMDENTYTKSSQFIVKIRLTSKAPSLALEGVEHHVNEIGCYDSNIHVYFNSNDTMSAAYDELSGTRRFFLITAHEGCNKDGERNAHLVSAITLVRDRHLIVFSTTHVQWRDVIYSMTLDFGPSNQEYEVRRHASLEKRQLGTLSAVPPASSGVATLIGTTQSGISSITPIVASFLADTASGGPIMTTSSALSLSGAGPSSSSTSPPSSPSAAVTSTLVDFPYPPTTVTAAAATVTEIFDKQWLDTAILPPDSSLDLTLSGPLIPAGFSTKCKNCTITGSIDLVHGSFNIDSSSNNSEYESITDFAFNGYAELKLNNFAAHIELESSIKSSKTLTKFIAPLPVLKFTPFQIPGIAAVGPQLNPQISIAVQVEREQDFTYGFDMIIPDGSSVTIDIHNITNSTISGFSDTNITALPFQSGTSDFSLNLITGFHPSILLGFSFLGNHGTAGAGVFLDLPLVTASISSVSNVYSDCTPHTSVNSSMVNNITADISGEVFNALTHITGSVSLDVGLVAEAELNAIYTLGGQVTWNALSTEWALPTTCLSFDIRKALWGPATATSTSSASATISTEIGKAKSAAVSCVRISFKSTVGLKWAISIVVVMLLEVGYS